MNPELHDQLYNLAPYLVLGLMVISGLLISRLRRPEDPFMKGRERYLQTDNPDDLHPEDSLKKTLIENGIPPFDNHENM